MTARGRLSLSMALGLPLAGSLALLGAQVSLHLAATLVLFALLAGLAVTDWRSGTVPDALTLALAATGLGFTALSGGPLALHAAAAAALLAFGTLQGRFTADDGWVGSGDWFLLAGIIAWFGPVLAVEVALIASLVVIVTCILTRRAEAPLAPGLGVAAALIWIGGPIL